MPNDKAPLIAPAIYELCAADFSLDNFTQPLPGWQQVTLTRYHPKVGTGASTLIVTVMPNGNTVVLDPYQTTCGVYFNFEAALQYLKGEKPYHLFGITIDFPQAP